MWQNPQFPADLVTFTEEIFNGKLYFLCNDVDSTQTYKYVLNGSLTAQNIKFSMKDFFSKCDQIHCLLWIWSHLMKKP